MLKNGKLWSFETCICSCWYFQMMTFSLSCSTFTTTNLSPALITLSHFPSLTRFRHTCSMIPHRVIFLTLNIKDCTKCNIKVFKYFILDIFARLEKKLTLNSLNLIGVFVSTLGSARWSVGWICQVSRYLAPGSTRHSSERLFQGKKFKLVLFILDNRPTPFVCPSLFWTTTPHSMADISIFFLLKISSRFEAWFFRVNPSRNIAAKTLVTNRVLS